MGSGNRDRSDSAEEEGRARGDLEDRMPEEGENRRPAVNFHSTDIAAAVRQPMAVHFQTH